MRVVQVPVGLRLAAGLLFVCVPLAALETVVVSRAPWWRLPYQAVGIWSLAVFLICLPLFAWILHGKRWAFRLTEVFLAIWLVLSAWVAIRMRLPSVGFFTLLLLWAFGGLRLWLRHELGRSFFDPRMRWFHGLPKPVPGLTAQLAAVGEAREPCLRVARLDREGVFVFGEDRRFASLRPTEKIELTLRFRDREVRCQGLPVREIPGGRGAGFQFAAMAPDLRKQLGDFIESLRGEGYVL